MNSHFRLLAILLLLISFPSLAQRVVWWNVENLFDCSHDSLRQDYDFLPQGSHRWTPRRYWHKMDNISRTLAALCPNDTEWPMLIGLGEVENDTVLRDLTRRSPLRVANYAYVHYEGPDVRGIDCALLYQPHLFGLLGSESIRVPSEEYKMRATRDLLHCWGVLAGGDTLHVICIHFPSRAGGTRTSALHRKLAVETLCTLLEGIGDEKILVMGDFNANADDPALRDIVERMVLLTPTGRKEKRKPQGTYCYRGLWEYIDHILVSKSLSPYCSERITVGRFPFLLTREGVPYRTFLGPSYQGGISDHLPIWADLFIR